MIFTLGVSYPLSLYRDIAKVRDALFDLAYELLIGLAGKSEYIGVDQHGGHSNHSSNARIPSPSGIQRYLQHASANNQQRGVPSHRGDIIRFVRPTKSFISQLTCPSIRLPPQLSSNIRIPQNPHHRPLRARNPLQHRHLDARLPAHGPRWLPNVWLQNRRQRPQQLPLGQHNGQHRASLLRPQHAHHSPTRSICLPRSHVQLLVPR